MKIVKKETRFYDLQKIVHFTPVKKVIKISYNTVLLYDSYEIIEFVR